MSLKDLLEYGANVTEAAGSLKPVRQEPPPEDFLSRKEVLSVLRIDSSTLWCWEKTGYIKSFPFGGRKRYKRDDVEAIRTGKKGVRRHG